MPAEKGIFFLFNAIINKIYKKIKFSIDNGKRLL